MQQQFASFNFLFSFSIRSSLEIYFHKMCLPSKTIQNTLNNLRAKIHRFFFSYTIQFSCEFVYRESSHSNNFLYGTLYYIFFYRSQFSYNTTVFVVAVFFSCYFIALTLFENIHYYMVDSKSREKSQNKNKWNVFLCFVFAMIKSSMVSSPIVRCVYL